MTGDGIEGFRRMVRDCLPERMRLGLRPYGQLLDACHELVRHGMIHEVMPALTMLARADVVAQDAKRLLATCNHLRRTGLLAEAVPLRETLDFLRLPRDTMADAAEPDGALVRSREGAETVLLVFTAPGGNFWISLDLLHQFLRPFPWHIVYLRDERACFHLAGLNGLGRDYAGTIEGLRQLTERLGARTIHCMGGSSGGYPALRFGLDLGARSVMVFSAPTTLVEADWYEIYRPLLRPLQAAAPHMASDLMPLYAAAAHRPRAILCYGGQHEIDRDQAVRMQNIPDVELLEIENYERHDTLSYFAVGRKFDQIFERLTGAQA